MNVAWPWSSPTGSVGAGTEIGGSTGFAVSSGTSRPSLSSIRTTPSSSLNHGCAAIAVSGTTTTGLRSTGARPQPRVGQGQGDRHTAAASGHGVLLQRGPADAAPVATDPAPVTAHAAPVAADPTPVATDAAPVAVGRAEHVLEAQLLGDRLAGLAQPLQHAPRVDGVDRAGRPERDARAPGGLVEVARAAVGPRRHPEVELELAERRRAGRRDRGAGRHPSRCARAGGRRGRAREAAADRRSGASPWPGRGRGRAGARGGGGRRVALSPFAPCGASGPDSDIDNLLRGGWCWKDPYTRLSVRTRFPDTSSLSETSSSRDVSSPDETTLGGQGERSPGCFGALRRGSRPGDLQGIGTSRGRSRPWGAGPGSTGAPSPARGRGDRQRGVCRRRASRSRARSRRRILLGRVRTSGAAT